MRCAVYARYSSDLQRESSIEDQIRRCREFAQRRGWVVVEDYVVFDRAISGATVAGRQALESLVQAAKQKPLPFDKMLVDDTSRLARNVAQALNLIDTLKFHGVSMVAVSQGIDSEEKTARPLQILHGMMDEQYLVGLADKVHRGQQGRALKGLQPGGKCYGYANVPIEDPTRPGKYGRPAVTGVDLRIIDEQAAVVRRIFQMYSGGMGLARIAKTLNAEGVEAPQPPRTRPQRAWCPSSIREMLRNGRYRGMHVWNRTEKRRNPETGRKTSQPRPESEWVRTEVPQWRIVPEELWQAVQDRIGVVSTRFGARCCGGMNRTEQARRYLFSGMLVCGSCGRRMVIISGGGKRGYVRYGCFSHRYRGVCSNQLTIRQDRLEEQLLAALQERLVKPEVIDLIVERVRVELRCRVAERGAGGNGLASLQDRRRKEKARAERLAAAIAETGHSPTLLASLALAERELTQLDQQISGHRPIDVEATVAEVKDFVCRNLARLRELLGDRPDAAKSALGKHIRQLVLTPEERPTGPVYAVSGSLDAGVGTSGKAENDVMLVVARDGIEPPTPAFSGLRSTALIPLILLALPISFPSKAAQLLEQ